jgi:hypothetical protein
VKVRLLEGWLWGVRYRTRGPAMHIEWALTRRRRGQQMYRKKYRGLCFCMTVVGSFSARRERIDSAILYAFGMNCILPMKP